jgi:hypothetical protein
MLTILNTSIITEYGCYQYSPLTLKDARKLVTKDYIRSAIGHESTAQVISTLLGIDCPKNRMTYRQRPGDVALIFKLNSRPPEGKILSVDDIEDIGYSWGKLERIS